MSELTPAGAYENVLVNPPNSILCDMAEPRLKDALLNGGFILVNGLIVKPNGIVAAVTREPIEASGGTIVPGAFYQMYHRHTRRWNDPGSALYKEHCIKEAFLEGETSITLPGATEWFESRPVRMYPDRLAQLIGNAVTRLTTAGRPALPDRESRRKFLQDAIDEEFPEA